MYYIGLDVHKRTTSHCVKDAAGHVHQEGKIGSTRRELDCWVKALPQPRRPQPGNLESFTRLNERLGDFATGGEEDTLATGSERGAAVSPHTHNTCEIPEEDATVLPKNTRT
jgi:hypothetical protein